MSPSFCGDETSHLVHSNAQKFGHFCFFSFLPLTRESTRYIVILICMVGIVAVAASSTVHRRVWFGIWQWRWQYLTLLYWVVSPITVCFGHSGPLTAHVCRRSQCVVVPTSGTLTSRCTAIDSAGSGSPRGLDRCPVWDSRYHPRKLF